MSLKQLSCQALGETASGVQEEWCLGFALLHTMPGAAGFMLHAFSLQ